MASTTEPDSTPVAESGIAAGEQGIRRLQGGGLRFLDAHEIPSLDFRVVTRPQQNHDTQRWRLFGFGGDSSRSSR